MIVRPYPRALREPDCCLSISGRERQGARDGPETGLQSTDGAFGRSLLWGSTNLATNRESERWRVHSPEAERSD